MCACVRACMFVCSHWAKTVCVNRILSRFVRCITFFFFSFSLERYIPNDKRGRTKVVSCYDIMKGPLSAGWPLFFESGAMRRKRTRGSLFLPSSRGGRRSLGSICIMPDLWPLASVTVAVEGSQGKKLIPSSPPPPRNRLVVPESFFLDGHHRHLFTMFLW